MKTKNIKSDAEDLFEKYNIPTNPDNKDFEIWEVTPLKKGMKIYYESC